jgi:hypothetical protein
VSGEGFPENREIVLVDNRRARIHPSRHRRRGSGPPILEFVDRIVVKIVEVFEAVIAHHIGLLHDRRGDRAALLRLRRGRAARALRRCRRRVRAAAPQPPLRDFVHR